MLYSFVIYDLFMKLQMMANEGDKKATTKLNEINTMISDDEKYSKVENEVIQFFKDNCPLYFDRLVPQRILCKRFSTKSRISRFQCAG